MCHRGTFGPGVLAGLLMARLAMGQAALPVFHSGPWGFTTAPDGWTFSGLGPDYAGPDGHGLDGVDGGAAKFDDSGDTISVHFDGPPAGLGGHQGPAARRGVAWRRGRPRRRDLRCP